MFNSPVGFPQPGLCRGEEGRKPLSRRDVPIPGGLISWILAAFGEAVFLRISRNLSKVAVRRAQNEKSRNISRIFQEKNIYI